MKASAVAIVPCMKVEQTNIMPEMIATAESGTIKIFAQRLISENTLNK